MLLYEVARKKLKELSDGKPIPSMKQLLAEKENLIALKNEQYETYCHARGKLHELRNVQSNVNTMLQDGKQRTNARNTKKEI